MTQVDSKRLLLVDDTPHNLKLLQLQLQPFRYQLIVADGGRAAIQLFEEHGPDLVLLDLMMPEVDGFGVLAYIRAHLTRARTPVIVVTAQSERAYRLRALEAGANDYLEKPIDVPIMMARLRTLLALKESRDQLQASRDSLAARNQALEELQRQQRELIQFLAHDLRNQLMVVSGTLQWVQRNIDRVPADELAEAVSDGAKSNERLCTMVEDLLLVSNLEDSSFRIRATWFSIEELLHDVLAGYAIKAAERAVELINAVNGHFQFWGDPVLLRRVFVNILDNALRFVTRDGHVCVAARPGSQLEVWISNDGPSVPIQDRERIFQKFARNPSADQPGGSSGLGLYFCKRVVEAHGGSIGVLETAEWPTSFVVGLPLKDEDIIE